MFALWNLQIPRCFPRSGLPAGAVARCRQRCGRRDAVGLAALENVAAHDPDAFRILRLVLGGHGGIQNVNDDAHAGFV